MTTIARTARAAGLLAGLAYVALGVLSLVAGPVPDEHWGTRGAVVDLLGLIGFAATIVAAVRLRTLLPLGRLGLVGLRVAQVGLLAMSVESVVSLVHGGNTISVVFTGGLVLALLGFLLTAIAGLIRPGGRRLAALPFLGLLVGVGGGEHGGFVLLGLVWLTLAVVRGGDQALRTSSDALVTESH